MTALTLLGLAGALRRESTNRMLIREAARAFGPADFIEADLALPLYDGDLEQSAGIPDVVQRLADQIAAADAVVISTPEYNKGPSGVLKNALDWVSRTANNPWIDTPVAVMSSAEGRAGGERSQMVLRGFLTPFQPRLLTGPELHVADCRNQFDAEGRLISDRYAATLEKLMQKLRAEIRG
ncbi:NADPH-dependent FMN reductase [Pseudodonghicola xiamenensis]|uniref:NAD(P)H-dependent FMN reductase n=1 Tax=Pseudodonghicola xiamenensis TaxID=337702 RepID=A0A8J3H6I1_9RHOB|nr:NAD(P)H-dependent oxidoreductase [Pseudodonghicola xiamenensis]GHG84854.1 NAD(P)H-dependent FMN reductase [Pseudodonghicola xiamenensis]